MISGMRLRHLKLLLLKNRQKVKTHTDNKHQCVFLLFVISKSSLIITKTTAAIPMEMKLFVLLGKSRTSIKVDNPTMATSKPK